MGVPMELVGNMNHMDGPLHPSGSTWRMCLLYAPQGEADEQCELVHEFTACFQNKSKDTHYNLGTQNISEVQLPHDLRISSTISLSTT